MNKIISLFAIPILLMGIWSCKPSSNQSNEMPSATINLIQLNPGHFHAGLVMKSMYDEVDPLVHVYAPGGPDLADFQKRIESYNSRAEDPTNWVTKVYAGNDYLEKMLKEKPGNVMVTAGNNQLKTEYIKKSVEAGLNVFSDKPMVISADKFPMLLQAFSVAEEKGVLLYDIMTERHEITTILQRELSMLPEVFGELVTGSAEDPAITKESVHHLFKYVSGKPLQRPAWFFDVKQQGTGLADIGTHLVDLIQWECYPGQIIDYKNDVEMLTARSWATVMDAAQFKKVTGMAEFPENLGPSIKDGKLHYNCNGEMIYRLKGTLAKVSVVWNFQAPEGTGDTHFSIMRGTGCNLVIRQGGEEGYKPTLYVETGEGNTGFAEKLETAVTGAIASKYPGVAIEALADGKWKVVIPDKYKVGHEAHFAQVMNKYLGFLDAGEMPDWEVPNMIAKYYTTTSSQTSQK